MAVDRSQLWTYVEPGPDDVPVVRTFSEQEILDTYYGGWEGQMRARGKLDEISEDNCIADWVTVNWASKV